VEEEKQRREVEWRGSNHTAAVAVGLPRAAGDAITVPGCWVGDDLHEREKTKLAIG
jgi:hypothetical protein